MRVSHGNVARNLSIVVALQPYPSCKHTKFALARSHTEHNRDMDLWICPQDTDDLPLTKTEFEYQVVVWYVKEATKSVFQCKERNRKKTSVKIPHEHLRRQGTYSVSVELIGAFSHTAGKPLPCKLPLSTFKVSCAGGFAASTNNSNCLRQDFMQVCEKVAVKVGSNLLSGKSPSVWIDGSTKLPTELSVSLLNNFSNFGATAQVQDRNKPGRTCVV